jgi:hypothetical protein
MLEQFLAARTGPSGPYKKLNFYQDVDEIGYGIFTLSYGL